MNTDELRKILDEHKIYVESFGESGSKANLRNANLSDADLTEHTYVIMGEEYPITITNGKYLRADCQNHSIEDWRKFTKREIEEMGGEAALKFYPRLLDIADFYLGEGERPEWLDTPDTPDSEEE